MDNDTIYLWTHILKEKGVKCCGVFCFGWNLLICGKFHLEQFIARLDQPVVINNTHPIEYFLITNKSHTYLKDRQ